MSPNFPIFGTQVLSLGINATVAIPKLSYLCFIELEAMLTRTLAKTDKAAKCHS